MSTGTELAVVKRRARRYFQDEKKWVPDLIKILCMVLAALVFGLSLRVINVQSNYGIDVSSHNGDINWSDVRRDGVSFAVIRCGGRAYGKSARIYEDTEFRRNLRHAHRNGMRVGIYFYSQATSEDEARAEAQFCLDSLKGADLELPIFLDLEDTNSGGRGRADNLDSEQRDNIINAFCKVIRSKGYKAGIYANRWFLTHELNVDRLDRSTAVWLAEYNQRSTPIYDGKWDIWQYTEQGKVNGIEGTVDLNRFPVSSVRENTSSH